MKTAYHFTAKRLRDGSPIPPIGEWLEYLGEIRICQSGYHYSLHPFDALKYAPGSLLHIVEVDGIVEEQEDKGVARRRRIHKTLDAEQLLRSFARQCALDVIHLWDAPEVVKEYLTTGDESLRLAAWNAAWAARDAARAAAWAADKAARDAACAALDAACAARAAAKAARDAASDAACAAAWAARDAARDAAWNAAWAAAGQRQRERFKQMVDEAFEETQ